MGREFGRVCLFGRSPYCIFAELSADLFTGRFDLSHSGADKKPALASINKLRESVSQAIDASRSLIHQHERFSHAMANALADTCDSDTGELLRPEELNGLGDKIQRLSALLAEHVKQMQERLVELTELFEELRKEVQESRRQKILRFLQTLFKVLEVILTAVTVVAPIVAPGVGILVSAGTAGGAALIAAASKLCKEAEKGMYPHILRAVDACTHSSL